jgi:mono/diheme cytochrome c family protein
MPVIMTGLAALAAVSAMATTPGPSEVGRAVYQARCLECHGVQGRGDGEKATFLSPRPGNLVSAATSAKSDRDLLRTIRDGKPRTAMPAWKDILTEEEMQEVLRYVRSLVQFSRQSTPSPPSR